MRSSQDRNRKDGDLLTALSWALGQKKTTGESVSYIHKTTDINVERTLNEAAIIINHILHKDISQLQNNKTDPKDFNMDAFISKFKFIQDSTKTVRLVEKYIDLKDKKAKHTKLTRQVFIICTLMLCTNSKFHTALHMLLTDCVELCGGSRELIKFLTELE